jgi:hypothetical protein
MKHCCADSNELQSIRILTNQFARDIDECRDTSARIDRQVHTMWIAVERQPVSLDSVERTSDCRLVLLCCVHRLNCRRQSY